MQGGRFISEDKKRKELIGGVILEWTYLGEHMERYAAEVKSERMDDL